jgi:DNA adenine methylase
MGSKSKIQKEILPIILKDIDKHTCYIEPFAGGLGTMDKVPDKVRRIASDYNPFLIAMWLGLKHDLEKPTEIPKELYDEYRNKFNKLKNNLDIVRKFINIVSSGFIGSKTNDFLNEHIEKDFKEYFLIGWIGFMASFNGRFYDGGYSGKTATRDYVDEQIRNTLSQVPLLKNIIFYTYDYPNVNYLPNSLIYCDIPYRDTKQYAFSTNFDYEKFYNWCREMTEKRHKVYISEYWMPDDFTCVWEKEVTNSLNTTKTYKPIEKLFTLIK